jgi:hypothetical protein
MTRRSQTKGFGIIAAAILIAVTALLVFASWKVYDMWSKNATTSANSAQDQTDLYAGWKTYCHNVQPICFKHPAGWTIEATHDAHNDVYFVNLSNPSRSLRGHFASLDNSD